MQIEAKNKMKRIITFICTTILLVTSVFYSANYIEAEESETKSVAKKEYAEIVTEYKDAVDAFEKNSESSMYTGIENAYQNLKESLQKMSNNLQEQIDEAHYTQIFNLYSIMHSTLTTSVSSYITELENISTSLPANDTTNKVAVTTLLKEAKSLKTNITAVIKKLKLYTDKYENNKTYSDGVEILIDYYGGKYNQQSSMKLVKLPGEEFGIISPVRTNYVFSGWEVLIGDTKVDLKNGSYIVTTGSQTTIIRAIWKTVDGQDAPAPTVTPTLTSAPTSTPAATVTPTPKQIDVKIFFEGGTYNGQNTMTQKVASNNTVVLFDNVDLIRRDGYKIVNFVCSYGGTCKILEDKRVVYSAPSYNTTKTDLISVIWEECNEVTTSASPVTQNTVYVDLNGGSFVTTGKQTDVFYVDFNTTKMLFKTSDIKKDGYTLQGFKVTDGVKYIIQDEEVILLPTDYILSGLTLTAIWLEKVEATPSVIPTQTESVTIIPTVTPTQTPMVTPTLVPIQVPTAVPTINPTVTPESVKIELDRNSITLGVDEGVKINAKASNNATITYESEDSLVCGVTEDGTIIGRKAGMTQVKVCAGNKTKKINVCVMLKPTKLCLTSSFKTKVTYTLKKGKTKQLMIYFYKNSYSNKITFKSSNKKIATVSSSGKVKAKKKGKCKITVKTYNGKKAVATIKVK